jgi:SH3 domain protein
MPLLIPTALMQARSGDKKIMLKQRRQKTSGHFGQIFFPITVLIQLAAILFFGLAVHAETWHIKPSSEVPIRTGQGTEYKILAVLPDGLKVELIEEIDPWAKVRTPGGTEGWMLKRYLSNDPPLSEMVNTLSAEKAGLKEKEEEISRKYDELITGYSQIEQEYNACLADRDDIRKKYQILQEDTADVIKIKQSLSDSDIVIQELRQKLEAVEQKNQNLKNNSAVKWFMAGGLVLILGWLIGLMAGRSSRKKSSLY